MDADLVSALLLVLWAAVVDVAVVEATFCGLGRLLLLLLVPAQEEVHGDVGDCEDYFWRRDGCRRLFLGGCGALPCLFLCLVVLVKKLG